MDNPLIPDEVSSILAQYSPRELAAYKARGMLDSRGIPTIPPGQPINSSGIPYSPAKMTEQEKMNNAASYAALRSGTFWGQPNAGQQSTTTPTDNNLSSPRSDSFINKQLDLSTMRELAKKAGFQGSSANLMAAIAMAESTGWTNAHNPKYPDDSYGITQINALAHGPVAKEAYNNPQRAMELAFQISKGGTNFKPWATYTSGSYKQYLDGQDDGNGVVAGKAGISGDSSKNAGLSGQINMGPLGLPEDAKIAKDKVAEALKGQSSPADGSSLSSSMALLSLLGSYKITPITYDPWKYVPKVTLDPLEV